MNDFQLYSSVCKELSQKLTKRYSTSFSLGIRMFEKSIRAPIASIYGFVRLADEIVDSFHHIDKEKYLHQFRQDTFLAIQESFSLNPILHAFQEIVHQYQIELPLIDAFLNSMEMDLTKSRFSQEEYDRYIYGSAEVIGLMCLKVFTYSERSQYEQLKDSAQALGSAFQEVNFLRDFGSDQKERSRIYFPNVKGSYLLQDEKKMIEQDIQIDFDKAFEGIKRIPSNSRLGVYVAYRYYRMLLMVLSRTDASSLTSCRMRISDRSKYYILLKSYIRYSFNIL
ncbi:MAG: phytoene/squalene synthase family protein [Saprospiraceae bacterium]|nr:phytoene/squalene synthase family protein [Saprospiraceae bacterium]